MSRYLSVLSTTARQMAADNGHKVTKLFRPYPGKLRGTCNYCGMEVIVKIMPKPGEERFSGRAIKERCDG